MTVKVYTNPTCQPCRKTKQALQARGIEYQEIDLYATPDAIADIAALGYRSVPVVVTETDHWTGYEPDRLAAL